jgi:hypothetical protein
MKAEDRLAWGVADYPAALDTNGGASISLIPAFLKAASIFILRQAEDTDRPRMLP